MGCVAGGLQDGVRRPRVPAHLTPIRKTEEKSNRKPEELESTCWSVQSWLKILGENVVRRAWYQSRGCRHQKYQSLSVLSVYVTSNLCALHLG